VIRSLRTPTINSAPRVGLRRGGGGGAQCPQSEAESQLSETRTKLEAAQGEIERMQSPESMATRVRYSMN